MIMTGNTTIRALLNPVTLQVIVALRNGPRRSRELFRLIGARSESIFVRQLAKLARDGLTETTALPGPGRGVSHQLSPLGREFLKAAELMLGTIERNKAAVIANRDAATENARAAWKARQHAEQHA
jgi:DNA-binding HxlR family transcriptional regulator